MLGFLRAVSLLNANQKNGLNKHQDTRFHVATIQVLEVLLILLMCDLVSEGTGVRRSLRSHSSSNSSKVSTDYFAQVIENIKNGKYAPGTTDTYHSAWVSFNKFVVRLDRIPPTWEEKLALFLACLIEENRPPSTIRSYKSAIKCAQG